MTLLRRSIAFVAIVAGCLCVLSSGARAQQGDAIVVLGLRSTGGPEAYATRLEQLPEAQALREIVESVVVANSGRQTPSPTIVRRLLGQKYMVSLYDCASRVPCIERLIRPLRDSVIAKVVEGDYYLNGDAYEFRLRFYDTRHDKLDREIRFSLPIAQRDNLEAWSPKIAPALQDTGSVTLVTNVPIATCELDRKACERDANETIGAVAEGEHVLRVSAQGYGEESKVFTVTRGENTRVVISLQRLNTQGLEAYQVPAPPEPPAATADGGAPKKKEKPLVNIAGGIEPTYARVFRGPPPIPLNSNNSFYLRRVFISFSGSLLPSTGYRVSVEFGQLVIEDSPAAGPLRDAHLWLRWKGQELRLGQFKVPFGWERFNSSITLPTTTRSIITPRLTTEFGRDIGAGVFGTVEINDAWSIEDAFSVTNGEGLNQLNAYPRLSYAGRVGIAHEKDFAFGVSGETVSIVRDGVRENTKRFGADVRLDLKYFFGVVEGGYTLMTEPIDTTQWGIFTMLLGKFPGDIEAGGRFELLDPNTKQAGNERRLTAIAMYHFIPQTVMFIVNYEYDMTRRLGPLQNILDEPQPGTTVLRVAARIRF